MTAALLACSGRDAAPVRDPLRLAVRLQAHDAEFGPCREDCAGAQLGCLLHDEVHCLRLDEGLQQINLQLRLGKRVQRPAKCDCGATPAQRFDGREAFTPSGVKDDNFVALATAKHATQIMCLFLVEAEALPVERRIDEYSLWRFSGSGHGEEIEMMDYSSSLKDELTIDPSTGWLNAIERVPSPNSDDRPVGCEPSLIVVHGISLPPGEFGGPWIDRLFTNSLPPDEHDYFTEVAHLRVSAHVLIRRDGVLRQYVPFRARAWHCGESSHCGRTACNDFSIGIELEGTDDIAYTDAQYERLSTLVVSLRRTYASLRDADIVGHEHIAPGRKTDPGPAFDWARLRAALGAFEA